MSRTLVLCLALALAIFVLGMTAHAQAQMQYSTQSQSSSQSTTTSRFGSGTTGSITEGITRDVGGFAEAGSQLTDAVGRTYRGMENQGVSGGDAQRTFLGPGTGPGSSASRRPSLQGLRQAFSATPFQQPGQPWQSGQPRGLSIRPTFTLGFAYKPKVSPKIGNNVRTCLRRIPNFGNASSIRVNVKKNVVVLEGTVARKSDRALALQLVALEPGVVKIDNRLKVAGTPSTTSATVH